MLGCPFTRQVWYALLHPMQLDTLLPAIDVDLDIADWWLSQRARITSSDRKVFDSMLLLVAWSLWKERNARVFGRPAMSVNDVVRTVVHEGEEWALGGFAPYVALAETWSRNYVHM